MGRLDAPAKDFQKNGYAVLPEAIDAKGVSALRKFCLSELERHDSKILNDVVINYPELRAVLDNPVLNRALKEVLGEKLLVVPPATVDHNRFGFFHTDTSSAEIAGFLGHRAKDWGVVIVGVYLQDNDQYGGGLRVVPGSHNQPDEYVDLLIQKQKIRSSVDKSLLKKSLKRLSGGKLFNWKSPLLENHPGQIDVPTKAGDIMFWDMRIVHRASPRIAEGEGIPGGKIAIFYTVARDNEASRSWVQYWQKVGNMSVIRPPAVKVPVRSDNYEYL